MLKEHTYTQPRKFTAAIQMAHYTLHSVTRDLSSKDNSRYVTIIITPTTAPPGPKEREREWQIKKKFERMFQIFLEHLL